MTVTMVSAWRPEVLADGARRWQARSDHLSHLGVRLATAAAATSPAWRGAAADAARHRLHDVCTAVADLADRLAAAACILHSSSAELSSAASTVARGRAIASAARLAVDDDGRVQPPPPLMQVAGAPAPWRAPVDDAWRSAQALLRSGLSAATTADRRGASALTLGPAGSLLAGLTPPARPPAPGSDPYAVAAWWRTLPNDVRATLAATRPEALGALDGLPTAVRDACNRRLLDDVETSTRGMLLAVAAADREAASAYAPRDEARRRAATTTRLIALLATCAALRRALAAGMGPHRFLLAFDPTGERAAVAVGDPDEAEHVAVLVPGFSTTVADDIEGDTQTAARVAASATAAGVDAGDRPSAAGAPVAAVAWLGYVAPRGADVTGTGRARAGATALTAALRGVDAASAAAGPQPHATHLSVVGHSYGSVVVGLAERSATGADEVIVLGSPGAGVTAAGGMQVAEGHVFAAGAAGDIVADLGRFGPVPDARDFGATRLQTDGGPDATGRPTAASHGHSDYFTEGSESLRNLGWVISGHAASATTIG